MDFSLPRGIRDIAPNEYAKHTRVREAFEEVSREYGFALMEPASIEHIEVLRIKSGEQIDKEIYAFKDKGGRELGLRFDLTVGITRYICSKRGLKLPAKVAAFGGMWRYDEPQFGRYRWAHQWDLEIFGAPSLDLDAEVIDGSSAILRKLGIANMTRIGDRRVVEDVIRTRIGISDVERAAELMRALDKAGKKPRSELEREYLAKGFSSKQFDSLIELGELKGDPEEVVSKAAKLSPATVGELERLIDILKSRGVRDITYDMSVVRGIDYYTGVVFEAVDKKQPRLGSLLGGGRYDTLPKLFGRPELSATGAAGGVERESMSIKEETSFNGPRVLVACAEEGLYSQCLGVLSRLRASGIPSDMSPRGRPLGKQLEDAATSGCRWVIIIGRRETEKSKVTLKNLVDRSEKTVLLDEALREIG